MSTPTWNFYQPTGPTAASYASGMEGDRDAELYLSACQGDRDSVTELVRCYQPSLLRIARAMGLPEHTAVDVVQLAWFRFFQHVKLAAQDPTKMLDNPAAVRGWLATTTRNATRDVYRKRKPTLSIDAEPDDGRPPIDPPDPLDITENIEDEEMKEAAGRALLRLDEPCRELVALLIADPPLSYEEIGEILGRPVGSIGPTRSRCLERLRNYLKGEGYE